MTPDDAREELERALARRRGRADAAPRPVPERTQTSGDGTPKT